MSDPTGGPPAPEAIVLSWQDGRDVFSSRLGTDPGPFRQAFVQGHEGMPLPPGTTLILERTSSGLWWASAEGPGVRSWTADGAGLHLAQAVAPGSTLLLGELKVLVWAGELNTVVPRTPRTPIGAPLDDEEEGGEGDAPPEAAAAGDVPALSDDAIFYDDGGDPAPRPPVTGAPGDDRLLFNLTAPREELLGAPSTIDPGAPDDHADTVPDFPAAPAPVSMPSPAAPAPAPAAPAPAPAASVAAPSPAAEADDSAPFPMRHSHATPATALPRAPGPNDVWVVHLEHRVGASTRDVTLVHPPSTRTMLIVGRDPDSALQLTDPEVAPQQLGLQLVQGDVRVHPYPETELALVVDGRQVDRPRRLREGAILSFGRHALRLVSSRIAHARETPPDARVARTVFQPACLELKWQLESPGRPPRSHQQTVLGNLGQAPRLVVAAEEPADWVLPGLGQGNERFELVGARPGEVVVRPMDGRLVLDGSGLAHGAPMRRGQVLETSGLQLMLIEATIHPPRRLSWHPTEPGPPSWIQAARAPAVDARKLVLDLRAKHPSGAEELVSVVAQAGWGAACVTIGREEDNDLVLRVATVSRTHAVLRFVSGGIVLRDVSGRGSAWINKRPVQTDAVVIIGDSITLGDVRLDVVGVSCQDPERELERRRVRVTVALQVSGAEGPELYRVDRVIWSDRAALLRVGAHPSSDVTLPGAPISLGRFEVSQRGVVFVDGTGQGGRFYGGRAFERAAELVEGDAVEVGGVLMRFVGATVVDLDS